MDWWTACFDDFVIENIDVEIARRKTDEILKILKIKQNEC
jgi:dephospho-CoA kinase